MWPWSERTCRCTRTWGLSLPWMLCHHASGHAWSWCGHIFSTAFFLSIGQNLYTCMQEHKILSSRTHKNWSINKLIWLIPFRIYLCDFSEHYTSIFWMKHYDVSIFHIIYIFWRIRNLKKKRMVLVQWRYTLTRKSVYSFYNAEILSRWRHYRNPNE